MRLLPARRAESNLNPKHSHYWDQFRSPAEWKSQHPYKRCKYFRAGCRGRKLPWRKKPSRKIPAHARSESRAWRIFHLCRLWFRRALVREWRLTYENWRGRSGRACCTRLACQKRVDPALERKATASSDSRVPQCQLAQLRRPAQIRSTCVAVGRGRERRRNRENFCICNELTATQPIKFRKPCHCVFSFDSGARQIDYFRAGIQSRG